jgi:hypothetical protein
VCSNDAAMSPRNFLTFFCHLWDTTNDCGFSWLVCHE